LEEKPSYYEGTEGKKKGSARDCSADRKMQFLLLREKGEGQMSQAHI